MSSSDPRLFRRDVEHVLGPEIVKLLHAWAGSRGIRPERWATQKDLWQVASSQAAIAIIAEERAGGSTLEAATDRAAMRVGVSSDALEKRLERFRRNALGDRVEIPDKLSEGSGRGGRYASNVERRKSHPNRGNAA